MLRSLTRELLKVKKMAFAETDSRGLTAKNNLKAGLGTTTFLKWSERIDLLKQ